MTTKTIEYVHPEPRDWTNDKGQTMWFPTVNFDDGSEGSGVAFSKAQADEWLDAFRAIKDTPTDFTLEDGGEFKGTKKWKIKDFPGKPAGGGGGGGGRGGGGGMSHVQAGYLVAATVLGPILAEAEADDHLDDIDIFGRVEALGELFVDHFFSRRKNPTETETTEAGGNGHTPDADKLTLQQMRDIKALAAKDGLDDDALLARLEVSALGELTKTDASLVIDSWA